MRGDLVLIPFISAAIGWLIHRLAVATLFYPVQPCKIVGVRFQGMLPRRREQLVDRVAELAARQILGSGMLEGALGDPAHFKKLMPVIEEQIDYFLRVKLKQSMPVVGMFIGDKTIGQLKTVFVTELETIFPLIMKNYAANLAGELNVRRLISEKLLEIPPETLVEGVKTGMKKEIQGLLWLGAVSGFFTGLATLVLWWVLK
jgi:uncharacterized membrane protein YheB (UPF0754 family)